MTADQLPEISGLVAYPSTPSDLGATICRALERLRQQRQFENLESWEENDIPGRFIATAVLQRIEAGCLFVADITQLNFNVIFEVGRVCHRVQEAGVSYPKRGYAP